MGARQYWRQYTRDEAENGRVSSTVAPRYNWEDYREGRVGVHIIKAHQNFKIVATSGAPLKAYS